MLAAISIFLIPDHINVQYGVIKMPIQRILEKHLIQLIGKDYLINQTLTKQVAAFNETILNVFRNYVPNKYITIDDKDPAWINENVKTKIKEKNTF